MVPHSLVQLVICPELQRKVIGVFASSVEHALLVNFDTQR